MSREILQDIVNNFSPEKFSRFFRDKNRSFSPRQEDVRHYDDENFKNGLKLGEIQFTKTEKLIVCAFQVKQSLSERSGKKAQYEKGKKILKDTQSDAGIFIFYDQTGNFRFSLIYPETIGNRRQWSSFRRFTYFVSREFTNKTFLQRIGDNEFSSIEKIKDAFSVEKVTKEFYLEYRKIFEILIKDLSSNHTFTNEAAKNDINTENFAKKLLGQIVFIYFIQKKGWMGVPAGQNWGAGDKNFLINQFKEAIAKKSNFFNDYLESLFYGTLNNPRRNSADPSFSKEFNSRIPFLNGGLFEAEYDWKNSFIYLDNNIFKSIFDVFERFNFTVEEESPDDKEIAVDPEMLGKVFENLLQENFRKGSGAYYTPREIVYYMCQESLVNYFDSNSKLGNEKIEKCVKSLKEVENLLSDKEAVELDGLLETIKICDPACGSGAFLVGMLNEIVRLRLLLRVFYPSKLSKKSEYQLKKDAIHNCLYGVDIDPGAIEIAKLRLWLALVVDYEIREIEPLPNLDYRLMCGNSLIEEFEGVRFYNGNDENHDLGLFKDTKKQEKIEELEKKVEEYFDIHDDEEKRSKRKEINDIKDWLIKTALEKRRKELASHRKSEEAKLNMFNEESRKKYFENWGTKFLAEGKINEVLRNLHDPRKTKPFFIWKLEFIDVFEDKGGFDVVIANPPYVQLQKEHGELAEQLKDKGFKTFDRTGDIYALFYEKGFQILKEKGIHAFITSSQWMKAGYGRALRKYFLDYNPLKLIMLGPGVFESAIVDTNIFIATKEQNTKALKGFLVQNLHQITHLNIKKMQSMAYVTDEAWVLMDPIRKQIKEKIENKGRRLTEWNIAIYRGVLTGLNEAFIIDQSKRDELIKKEPKSSKIIVPILRGREVNKYYTQWDGGYLINTHNGVKKSGIDRIEIDEIPHVKIYLQSFGKKLMKRADQGDTPYNLRNCAYLDEFEKEKIIWKRIGSQLRFSYSNEKIFCLDSTCIATGEKIKYLTALLNSKLCRYQLYENSPKTGMGDLIISVQALEPLYVYYPDKEQETQIVSIFDRILTIVKSDGYQHNSVKQAKVKECEGEIDQMVYKLYGLTKDEVEVIEKSLTA